MSTQQAVAFARAGLRVAIIGDTAHREVREAEMHAADDAGTIVLRSKGQERIAFTSGGQLTFHRTGDDLRGHRLDVAYLTSIALATDGHTVVDLTPCFTNEGSRPRIGVLV